MPGNPALSIVVVEVIRHTPHWVWAILAAIILLGALQLREQRVSPPRLALLPLALGGFSLWGAASAFGSGAVVLLAWAAGVVAALAANLRWPRQARWDPSSARFAVPGSAWPLALMLAIFALRYAVKVTLVFHPSWAEAHAFAWPLAASYGLLSGLFLARARRILQIAQASAVPRAVAECRS